VALITIARELAALGDEVAQELVRLLGYRLVSKHSIEERIKTLGIAEEQLAKYDERKPSFFASLSHERDDYLHYLKTAFIEEAEKGDSVFIGRGVATLFKGIPGIISLFLTAPLEIRLRRVESYFHCDEKAAHHIIEQSDENKIGFHLYFFESNWRASDQYHLTLNTGVLHPALCAELVQCTLKRTITSEIEEQSALAIKDLKLGQDVKHYILYKKRVPIHFLEVSSVKGKVTLYGVANSLPLAETALNAAQEIHGDVHSEIQVVRDYNNVTF
jgi:cytidylate kinase